MRPRKFSGKNGLRAGQGAVRTLGRDVFLGLAAVRSSWGIPRGGRAFSKAERAAHIAQVEAIFARDGAVKILSRNGVQKLIHASTRVPGTYQVTSFTEG